MRTLLCLMTSLGLGIALVPGASAKPIQCERVDEGTITVDGLRTDWNDLRSASLGKAQFLSGDKSKYYGQGDLSAKIKCGHTPKGVFLLVEVTDDQVIRTRRANDREDRVELVFDVGGGKVRTLRVHAASKRQKGRVKWTGRRPVLSTRKIKSKVFRLKNGYFAELQFKPGAIPNWGYGSPALKVSIRIIDVDNAPKRTPDAVIGTGGDTAATLGRIEFDTAKQLLKTFLTQKRLSKANIVYRAVGNYVTGASHEQLIIAGNQVALLGEDIMKGGAYYAVAVPFAKTQRDLLRFRSVDLDGNGNLDIVIAVRNQGTGGFSREVLVVLRFLDTGKFDLFLAQEIKKRQGSASMTNTYKFVRRGKKSDIVVKMGKNNGFTKQNYRITGGGRLEPLCTPWGKKKRHYQFQSDGYTEK